MCDYSQHGLPSRLSCEGELLITHRFPTKLIGLGSPFDIEEAERARTRQRNGRAWVFALKRLFSRDTAACRIPAVCVPPGARLRMTHIPAKLKRKWGLGPVEDVLFTEIGDDPERYRDASRFRSGKLVVLQSLPERVCFVVLSLGSDEKSPIPVSSDVVESAA